MSVDKTKCCKTHTKEKEDSGKCCQTNTIHKLALQNPTKTYNLLMDSKLTPVWAGVLTLQLLLQLLH
jgi:hypothetical protein